MSDQNPEYQIPEDVRNPNPLGPINKEVSEIYENIGGNIIYLKSQAERTENPVIKRLGYIAGDLEQARNEMIESQLINRAA